jgi:hypothetical protein
MNRRGFFSLLAGIAGAIGIGKVPWAGERRSPVKSPPATSYDWKQLHAPITLTAEDAEMVRAMSEVEKTRRLVDLIDMKFEQRTRSLEKALSLATEDWPKGDEDGS